LIADGELRQRLTAACIGCGQEIEVFDAFRNGYNAVICGEHNHEPPGREATSAYGCLCGGIRFGLGVVAQYDVDPDELAGFRKAKRSEAYGWFTVYATCRACKVVIKVVDYETA